MNRTDVFELIRGKAVTTLEHMGELIQSGYDFDFQDQWSRR
jgi:hypothetical protein